LDEHVTGDNAWDIPLAEYAAEFWVEHAQFEDVSSRIRDVMEYFFDADRPHWAAWLRVCNMDEAWERFTHNAGVPAHAVPLYYAALFGFYDLAEHLVAKNPEHVNAEGGQLVAPLVAAWRGEHFKVAELLLEHGANIDVRGRCGFTLLHVVSWSDDDWPGSGRVGMAQWLLGYGADVNARDKDDWVPLYMAIFKGHLELCQILQDHNADLGCRTTDGETLLHRAASPAIHSDQIKILRLLLDQGADVDARDNHGRTPLHYSSFWRGNVGSHVRTMGTVEGSRLLLEYGADMQAEDNDGKTPLQLALDNKRHKMAEFLLGMGAR